MIPCIKYFKGFIGCMGKMSYINIKLILNRGKLKSPSFLHNLDFTNITPN